MYILSCHHAYDVLRKKMTNDVEEIWVLGLNSQLKLQIVKMIFRGTVDQCFIHPRDIFRCAIKFNCSQLIIAHNHPSGDAEASQEDLERTKALIQASQILEIPLVDHLILTKKSYTSLAQQGVFQSSTLTQNLRNRNPQVPQLDLFATVATYAPLSPQNLNPL